NPVHVGDGVAAFVGVAAGVGGPDEQVGVPVGEGVVVDLWGFDVQFVGVPDLLQFGGVLVGIAGDRRDFQAVEHRVDWSCGQVDMDVPTAAPQCRLSRGTRKLLGGCTLAVHLRLRVLRPGSPELGVRGDQILYHAAPFT